MRANHSNNNRRLIDNKETEQGEGSEVGPDGGTLQDVESRNQKVNGAQLCPLRLYKLRQSLDSITRQSPSWHPRGSRQRGRPRTVEGASKTWTEAGIRRRWSLMLQIGAKGFSLRTLSSGLHFAYKNIQISIYKYFIS